MESDCSKELRGELVKVSKFHKDNLNRLNVEWSDFVDLRLKGI